MGALDSSICTQRMVTQRMFSNVQKRNGQPAATAREWTDDPNRWCIDMQSQRRTEDEIDSENPRPVLQGHCMSQIIDFKVRPSKVIMSGRRYWRWFMVQDAMNRQTKPSRGNYSSIDLTTGIKPRTAESVIQRDGGIVDILGQDVTLALEQAKRLVDCRKWWKQCTTHVVLWPWINLPLPLSRFLQYVFPIPISLSPIIPISSGTPPSYTPLTNTLTSISPIELNSPKQLQIEYIRKHP